MKSCACCSAVAADDAPSCNLCGEGSWRPMASAAALKEHVAEKVAKLAAKTEAMGVPMPSADGVIVAAVKTVEPEADDDDDASDAQTSLLGAPPAMSNKERKRRARAGNQPH